MSVKEALKAPLDPKSANPKPASSFDIPKAKSGSSLPKSRDIKLAGAWPESLDGTFEDYPNVARIETKATRMGEATCMFFSHEMELARGTSFTSMEEAVERCVAALKGEPLEPVIPDVPPVTLTPTSGSHNPAGGSGTFAVAITGGGASGTWTVEKDSDATWLTVIVPTTPQTTDGPVNYNVASNTGAERTGHFYVNGKTFTVTQAAAV